MAETLRLGKAEKRLDLEVIEKGVRKECPYAPGVYFRILPWGTHNPRFRRAFQKYAIRRVVESSKGDGEAGDILARQRDDPEFLADSVLPAEDGIEGLLNENGNEVKYTRERGIRVLADPELAHIREWVFVESWQLSQRFKEEVEDSGNSSRPASRGKKAGAAKSAKTKGS